MMKKLFLITGLLLVLMVPMIVFPIGKNYQPRVGYTNSIWVPPTILHHTYTNGSGTTVTAEVGTNGTGANFTWVTGKSGAGFALDFNGSSAYTFSTVAYGVPVITITGWVFLDDNTTTQVLIESSDNYNSNDGTYLVLIDAGTIIVGVSRGAQTLLGTYTAPATGAWVHLSLVMTDTFGVPSKVYYNGVLQTAVSSVDNRIASGNFATFNLFKGSRNGSSLFYNGRVDDLRIYNLELSLAEVRLVMLDAK